MLVIVGCRVGAIDAFGEVHTLRGRNQDAENLRNIAIDRYGLTEQMRAQYREMLDVTLAVADSVLSSVPSELDNTYALGFAYITPRQLWPSKPPSAAELLTDVIYAGAWNGSSYITAGIWGDADLNVG